MAGLFDLLGMQSQGGGGLFGNIGNYLNNNQDALIAMGLGLAGGNTAMEGLKGGLQGYLSGRKSDQQRVAGESFLKDMGLGVAPSSGPFSKPSPALPGATPMSAPGAPGGAAPSGLPNYANAIASIETPGARAPYEAVGPVTRTGARAYGKYQVMDFNIPTWTKEVLGQPMTPQQFVASPEAQEKVFQAKFGQYVQQFGNPQDAASMWFTGKPAAEGANRRAMSPDGKPYGITGQQYVSQFNAGLGQQGAQAPVQVAQAGGGPIPMGGGAPMPSAQPDTVPRRTVAPDQLGAIRNLPIETVMRWAMNPNLPENMAGVAKEIFKARLEDTKMMEAQKNYLAARVDGFKGSFADFQKAPEYKVIGKDRFGSEIYGWVNQNNQTATAAGKPAGASNEPPVDAVDKLRGNVEGLPSYKVMAAAAPVYNSMMASAKSDDRGADVDLVYGFAKLMDPGSVVRESEMTMAQAVATLPQAIQSKVMSQLTGSGRLDQKTRGEIMAAAHNRITAYSNEYRRDSTTYRGIAERRGMNTADVLHDFGAFQRFAPAITPSPPQLQLPQTPGPQWMDMGNGVRIRQKQ